MTKTEYEDYLKFMTEALELARTVPRYFSKFSNKIYCNHQKLVIIVLMQKLKLTTRGVVSFLRNNPSLCLDFGLIRIPVHTTLVRFFKKIKNVIGLILNIRTAKNVAIDSTGFELEAKSFYYRNINQHLFPNYLRKTKKHMKVSIIVDTDKQLILTYKIRKNQRHDTIDFKELLKDLTVKKVFGDKGYDSKKNRRFVINKLKATPIIPVKRYHNFYGYSKQNRRIDGKDYHQRSKVETVFSVLKRKYGSILRCKTYATQQTELISKLIAYNVDRKVNYLYLLILRGLHQSPLRLSYLFFSLFLGFILVIFHS